MDNIGQTAEGAVNPATGTEDIGQSTDLRSEIEGLKQQNAELIAKISEMVTAVKPKEPKPNVAELLQKDPAAAIETVVKQVVAQQLDPALKGLTKEQQRSAYDSKAESDFPAIKTDKEFQNLVRSQINEFVKTGEMDAKSPTLVYRAAQIAALKYKPKAQATTAPASMSGEAPNTAGSGNTAPPVSKNFDALVKMFGIKNVDQMKARLDKQGGKK